MRSHTKITKAISLCLSCLIIIELLLINCSSMVSADEEFKIYNLELYSNVYGAGNYIDVYERDGEYYISLQNLAFLARCQMEDSFHTCDLKQGIWRVTIDFDNKIFDDGVHQPSAIGVYNVANERVVPAIELLSYFGATYLMIDLAKERFYCLMPNYTAWEALDLDDRLFAKNIYSDADFRDILRKIDVLTELVMGESTTPDGYRKRAYDEVLKVDMLENEGVRKYITEIEEDNNEFLESEAAQELSEAINDEIENNSDTLTMEAYSASEGTSIGEEFGKTIEVGGSMTKAIDAITYAMYGYGHTWIHEMYKEDISVGLLTEEYINTQQVLDKIHKKIKSPIDKAGKVFTIASVAVNIMNSSLAEIKAVKSTDNLIGRVLGKDVLRDYSSIIDESWIKTAEEYKSKGRTFASNTIRAVVEHAIDEGIDQMLKEGFKTAGVAAQVGLITGRGLVKLMPFTNSGYESTKAELSAILLYDLQDELLKIIKEYYEKVDFKNEEEIQKLVDVLILYCRTAMVMYQELLTSKEADGFNVEHWRNVYQPKIDSAAISLYKLYTYSEDRIYRIVPLNYSELKKDVENNKRLWLVENKMTDENLDNDTIVSMFSNYISQKETMYGKSCVFTLQRTQNTDLNNSTEFDSWWEGISEGVVLGYSVEDFDRDGRSELFLVTLCEDNLVRLEMYEVIDGQVTLVVSKYAGIDSSYGAVELPCGSRTDGEKCGILSCFVQESDNRIFLQSSDSYGLITDGCDTFIASAIYNNETFEEYSMAYNVGSDIDGSIERLNQELSNMGVPNPNFDSMFYNSTPLIDCFGGGVHEILRAEQYTIDYEKEDSIKNKIVTKTVFATQDGQIEKPEVYTEQKPEPEPEITSTGEIISIDEFENGFWMSWDEFQSFFGEPDSNYTRQFQEYYIYENIEMLGNNGKISCQVGEDNMVYSVAWFAYEPNEELFETFLELLSERYEMIFSGYDESFASYRGKEGNNRVDISYSDTETQTSIQWSYNSY